MCARPSVRHLGFNLLLRAGDRGQELPESHSISWVSPANCQGLCFELSFSGVRVLRSGILDLALASVITPCTYIGMSRDV